MDKFDEKVVNLGVSLGNAYEDEESRERVDRLEMNAEDATEDLTAMLYATYFVYRRMTGYSENIIGFAHLLNRLAIQHIMESKEENEGV